MTKISLLKDKINNLELLIKHQKELIDQLLANKQLPISVPFTNPLIPNSPTFPYGTQIWCKTTENGSVGSIDWLNNQSPLQRGANIG